MATIGIAAAVLVGCLAMVAAESLIECLVNGYWRDSQ